MIPDGAASVISLLGFVTGTILYAMLLWMVLSSHATNPLALLTGICGLTWNLGSFAAYGLFGLGITRPIPLLLAMAFGALCFLPAVVVYSTVRTKENWTSRRSRAIAAAAYAMSSMASIAHFASAVRYGTAPSQVALIGLTAGYSVLLLILLVVTRAQDGRARVLWVAALAVFAVSALHLSSNHGGEDPWWLALIGHHASLPLALAILYQDYRFALADIFLKRALSLMLLVGLIFGVYTAGVSPLLHGGVMGTGELVLLISMWVGTALIYPVLRNAVGKFVDKVVLQRSDYSKLLRDASRAIENCETPDAVLQTVSRILTPALSSESILWDVHPLPGRSQSGDPRIVVISTAEAPFFSLTIGRLLGGRLLLSDDQAMLDRVAAIAGRRIDGLRAAKERYQRDIREEQMRKLAAEAELRALRAQINPHFLFNTLTTIGYLIQASPDRALQTLIRLSGLLRSVLRSGEEFVTLGEELDLIEAYLDIETARFEDRLRTHIDVPHEMRSLKIPTLLLQPLVENSVKHGISTCVAGGLVSISAALEPGLTKTHVLVLTVRDTGGGAEASSFSAKERRGVGLDNVERRVHCHGGPSASFSIQSTPGLGTTVEIRLPVDVQPEAIRKERGA